MKFSKYCAGSKATLICLAAALLLSAPMAKAIKIAHGPYLQNVTDSSATVVWISDKPSIGWIELAPDDGTNYYACDRPKFFDVETGIKRTTRIHSVKLTNLRPGTRYRYRVYAKEVLSRGAATGRYGAIAALDVFSAKPPVFTTLDKNRKETSFVVLNDIHQRDSLLEPMLKQADFENRDMVIYNGDMVNAFSTDSILYKGFLDETVRVFAKEKPWYYVRGNHETRGQAAETFHQYFCPREPHLYFAWQQGPVFFIALDTGEDKPDDDIEYYGFNCYDDYRTEQARWLKGIVNSEAYKKAPFHVVVAHIPPATSPDAWHGEIEVKEKFASILNKADVDVMICAHLHRFRYTPASADIHFPVVVNSNNSSLYGETKDGKLHLHIADLKGRTLFDQTFNSHAR